MAPVKPPEPKIELPAYYNPNVINVNKFAEQQKKRKLIWSGKKEEPAKDAAKWGGAKFAQDSDGTKASKFMRLMGIKDGECGEKFLRKRQNCNKSFICSSKARSNCRHKTLRRAFQHNGAAVRSRTPSDSHFSWRWPRVRQSTLLKTR